MQICLEGADVRGIKPSFVSNKTRWHSPTNDEGIVMKKSDKYIEVLQTWRNVCFVQQAKSGQLTSNLLLRNRTFLVSRHNRVVNAIIHGIKSKRVPLPMGKRNNNLHADIKISDVEFQKNWETWVLDVRFTKPYNEEERFASKTDKY